MVCFVLFCFFHKNFDRMLWRFPKFEEHVKTRELKQQAPFKLPNMPKAEMISEFSFAFWRWVKYNQICTSYDNTFTLQMEGLTYRCFEFSSLARGTVEKAKFCVKWVACFDSVLIYSCKKRVCYSYVILKKFWCHRLLILILITDLAPIIVSPNNLNISLWERFETL